MELETQTLAAEENKELEQEKKHLEDCRTLIQHNIVQYEQQAHERFEETQILFKEMHGGNIELYNQLVTSTDLEEHVKKQLANNLAALSKPYFGRIDLEAIEDGWKDSLYIGKHGITSDGIKVNIVDWRAPIAAVYYENELERGSYEVSGGEKCEIDLFLKRTYYIENGKLLGMYDSDVISNDELLIQYLSGHGEAVLRDIISTIQKEQNQIIRENPFRNVIVQGVAGSGKTTVATHRISYILYNYKERFTSNEFCIIGSNDNLLRYILSGLPELEVYNVKCRRMDEMLVYLLHREWKKRYRLQEIPLSQAFKSKLDFIDALEDYLGKIREYTVPIQSVADEKLGILIKKSTILEVMKNHPEYSLKKLLKHLDDRVKLRLKGRCEGSEDRYKQKKQEYKNYFGNFLYTKDILYIYRGFLEHLEQESGVKTGGIIETIDKKLFDVYDISAMVLIHYRVNQMKKDEEFGQIFIDEAQDFGAAVYYVLKTVLPESYFNIMGDVSQNIHYETGMNNWDDVKEKVFPREKSAFHILSKSYRNTIEIAEFANDIYKTSICEEYMMNPVIRHGKEVEVLKSVSKEEGFGLICDLIPALMEKEFKTIAVICFSQEESEYAQKKLSLYLGAEELQEKGIQVLPVALTKGLEFDVAILWRPDLERGRKDPKAGKQIYVGATRALHELYLVL